jgi:DNA-binding response OmpR family regulator
MMAAMATSHVALVSDDLMFASRLRAALAGKVDVSVVASGDALEAGTVFVDLNDDVEARLALIASLRARGGVRVIGFCQHDERAVRVQAMERGADQVVTNAALPEAAVRLVGAQTGG